LTETFYIKLNSRTFEDLLWGFGNQNRFLALSRASKLRKEFPVEYFPETQNWQKRWKGRKSIN